MIKIDVASVQSASFVELALPDSVLVQHQSYIYTASYEAGSTAQLVRLLVRICACFTLSLVKHICPDCLDLPVLTTAEKDACIRLLLLVSA